MKMRLFLTFICFSLFLACQSRLEKVTEVAIDGTVKNALSDSIKFVSIPVLGDQIILGESNLDSTGYFSVRFDISNPIEARLVHGRESTSMYLRPGDRLTIRLDNDKFDESISYSGQGSEYNNYLARKYLVEELYEETLETSNIYLLPLDSFLYAANGLKTRLNSHLADFFEEKEIAPTFREKELAANDIKVAMMMENYPLYHGYYSDNPDYNVEDSFFDFRENINMDNANNLSIREFRMYLDSYVDRLLTEIVEKDSTLENKWEDLYLMVYDQLQNDSKASGGIKEYLLSKQLNDYMSYFGTDGIEEYLESYKESVQNEHYRAILDKTFEKWAVLSKGQPAPDFKYTSINGEDIALSDLRDKVVYIDVWATWCGPCKREFPHAKKLKKKYEDNENVAFLYISVDEDKGAWEKFLSNDPEFKGIHLHTGTGRDSDIEVKYLINGIPRYILVDQEGRIVRASAPRPSSGEQIESMINSLLEIKGQSG
jgi:thiol-disulfide isomerase/thioredoxin